eukprot:1151095-Pelagomonas_calceolata.AAC.2
MAEVAPQANLIDCLTSLHYMYTLSHVKLPKVLNPMQTQMYRCIVQNEFLRHVQEQQQQLKICVTYVCLINS